jgi:hypothetical protein
MQWLPIHFKLFVDRDKRLRAHALEELIHLERKHELSLELRKREKKKLLTPPGK